MLQYFRDSCQTVETSRLTRSRIFRLICLSQCFLLYIVGTFYEVRRNSPAAPARLPENRRCRSRLHWPVKARNRRRRLRKRKRMKRPDQFPPLPTTDKGAVARAFPEAQPSIPPTPLPTTDLDLPLADQEWQLWGLEIPPARQELPLLQLTDDDLPAVDLTQILASVPASVHVPTHPLGFLGTNQHPAQTPLGDAVQQVIQELKQLQGTIKKPKE